ncbi:MAG: fibronectin type III domain-containing protein, partial [Candidatus Bathyarchaeota archaeon]|nr:fibronectin type III domain-containing protein [Candidatus Bathyarchaeota archaeon]
YNDNGNGNSSLEIVQIPTLPMALSRIFSWNEASINVRPLEPGSIPTNKADLRRIFVVHEFAGYQKDLAFPNAFFNDSAPPAITEIFIDNILSSEARINWTTDEFATSLVKYGGFPDEYETSKKDTLFTKNHSIYLDGLLPETKYYFAVNSTDRSGNSAEVKALEFVTSGT